MLALCLEQFREFFSFRLLQLISRPLVSLHMALWCSTETLSSAMVSVSLVISVYRSLPCRESGISESGSQCGAMIGRSSSVPDTTPSHCSGSSSLEGDNFVCLQGVGSRENNLDGLLTLKGLVRVYYSILRNS